MATIDEATPGRYPGGIVIAPASSSAGPDVTAKAPRLLLIETSSQPGLVGLAEGPRLADRRVLESGRHHARDLAPAVAALLTERGWAARDLDAVVVGRGPGSYTGLRVGLMTAKTLAYVTGCRLLAIDTFAVVAAQSPPGCDPVDVIADAQKDCIYLQGFRRQGAYWQPLADVCVLPLPDWLAGRDPGPWISGPGLPRYGDRLPPGVRVTPADAWKPGLEALLALGWQRFAAGERDDVFAAEPLYLRASSAELQWRDRQAAPRTP